MTTITTSATLATTNTPTTKPRTYAIKACQAQEGYFPTSRDWMSRGWSSQAGNLKAGSVEAWHRHRDTTYILPFIHGMQRVQYLAKLNAGCVRFHKEMEQTKHLRPQQPRMLGDRFFDVTKLMSNFFSPETSDEIGATSKLQSKLQPNSSSNQTQVAIKPKAAIRLGT
jgi:hypothetical protein